MVEVVNVTREEVPTPVIARMLRDLQSIVRFHAFLFSFLLGMITYIFVTSLFRNVDPCAFSTFEKLPEVLHVVNPAR
jgi:hypothetical protein